MFRFATDALAIVMVAFAPSRLVRFSRTWLMVWLAIVLFYAPVLVLCAIAALVRFAWEKARARFRPQETPK